MANKRQPQSLPVEKKPFIYSDWKPARLQFSEKWKDPLTGIAGSAFYIANNGLSSSTPTDEGHNFVVIETLGPDEKAPATKMVQLNGGRASYDKFPQEIMMNTTNGSLMELEEYQKACLNAGINIQAPVEQLPA